MDGVMDGIFKEFPRPGAEFRTDLPIPRVGHRDILVKVHTTAICGTDLHILPWSEYAQARVTPPMVFGHEFAGEVVETGDQVRDIKVGDRVAGETHIPCNHCDQCLSDNRHICENMKIIGVHTDGSFAQYIAFTEDCAFKLPGDIDYTVGSLLEPMGVAMHGIDAARVEGKNVVIYGCGPIGLMAVGIAKALKAAKVTALDIFAGKLDVALKMGADRVINSKETDAVSAIRDAHEPIDVVIDYTGSERAIRDGMEIVKKGGRVVLVGLPNTNDLTLPITQNLIYKEVTMVGVTGRLMYKTWEQCVQILRSGAFPIEQAVGGTYALRDFQKAFDAIKEGRPGKIVLLPWQ
jgi:threonine 3-dehydrogenase